MFSANFPIPSSIPSSPSALEPGATPDAARSGSDGSAVVVHAMAATSVASTFAEQMGSRPDTPVPDLPAMTGGSPGSSLVGEGQYWQPPPWMLELAGLPGYNVSADPVAMGHVGIAQATLESAPAAGKPPALSTWEIQHRILQLLDQRANAPSGHKRGTSSKDLAWDIFADWSEESVRRIRNAITQLNQAPGGIKITQSSQRSGNWKISPCTQAGATQRQKRRDDYVEVSPGAESTDVNHMGAAPGKLLTLRGLTEYVEGNRLRLVEALVAAGDAGLSSAEILTTANLVNGGGAPLRNLGHLPARINDRFPGLIETPGPGIGGRYRISSEDREQMRRAECVRRDPKGLGAPAERLQQVALPGWREEQDEIKKILRNAVAAAAGPVHINILRGKVRQERPQFDESNFNRAVSLLKRNPRFELHGPYLSPAPRAPASSRFPGVPLTPLTPLADRAALDHRADLDLRVVTAVEMEPDSGEIAESFVAGVFNEPEDAVSEHKRPAPVMPDVEQPGAKRHSS